MRGRRLRAFLLLVLLGAAFFAASAGCGRKAKPEPRTAGAAPAPIPGAHS
ncbi:MAG: hypothetical protein AB1346_07790 [Thermodesulfobacteriota bacterium]